MADPKEIPRTELSLKYMAWDVKEMSKSVAKIAACIERIATIITENNEKKAGTITKGPSYSQDQLPF